METGPYLWDIVGTFFEALIQLLRVGSGHLRNISSA